MRLLLVSQSTPMIPRLQRQSVTRPSPLRRPRPVPLRASAPDAPVRPFTADAAHLKNWKPDCWRVLEAKQQPEYPDAVALKENIDVLSTFPPLVFAGECRMLQSRLAAAAKGEAFVLQGGDCAEAFSQFTANRIRDSYRVLLQMGLVMMYGGGTPVVKMGRMAGQFAKPRSAPYEERDGVKLPSYRGDIINGSEFTADARIPDPKRLINAYNQSAATLNLLRGFSSGGYASLDRVASWDLEFMKNSQESKMYLDLAHRVQEATMFMHACGIGVDIPVMKETEFYTGHECLLLEYEEALTRQDSTTDLWYDCSGHFLWIGERTRQLDGAHLAFVRGIANPIGVKISNKISPSDLVTLVSQLNPENVPGRCSVIVRMGADKVKEQLPVLIDAVRDAGQIVTWITDPVHGNTESCNGYKTRRFEKIQAEVEAFFDVHEKMGSVPGGMHVEMTGENVTECIGGGARISEEDLNSRYHTHCDPRLNAEQALEIAFYSASRLRQRRQQNGTLNGVKSGEHNIGWHF